MFKLTDDLIKKFWSKVDKKGDNGCWSWTGGKSKGYGTIYSTKYGPLGAHRISWLLHKGKIPGNLGVLHKCDNPQCCNPLHLFLGTAKDNIVDASLKGRMTGPKGWKRTEENKRKISNTLLKMSKRSGYKNPMQGKKHSAETRKKLSESHKGKVPWMKGKYHSIESRQKISTALQGKPPTYGMLGKKHSVETKEKISKGNKGKIVSAKTRKRMVEAWKKRRNA